MTGTATPLALAFPASVAANDVAIIDGFISSDEVVGAFTATGFTVVAAGNPSSSSWSHAWAWKRCAGGETTVDFNMSSGGLQRGASCKVFRGCITSGAPYEGSGATSPTLTTTGTTITAPNIVTTGADRLGVVLSSHKDSNQTVPAPSGWTIAQAYDDHLSSGRYAISLYKTIAAAGTETGPTIDYAFNAAGVAFSFALLPEAAAPSGHPTAARNRSPQFARFGRF